MSFLPEAHIRPAFEKLTGIVDHALQKLVHYIAKTWINNSTYTISTWNVFVYQREPTPMLKGCIVASTKSMQTSSPPFYQLVEKLFEGKLSRFQRSYHAQTSLQSSACGTSTHAKKLQPKDFCTSVVH